MSLAEYRMMRPLYDAEERELAADASVAGMVADLADALAERAGYDRLAETFREALTQVAAELVVDNREPDEWEDGRTRADWLAENPYEHDRIMDERRAS